MKTCLLSHLRVIFYIWKPKISCLTFEKFECSRTLIFTLNCYKMKTRSRIAATSAEFPTKGQLTCDAASKNLLSKCFCLEKLGITGRLTERFISMPEKKHKTGNNHIKTRHYSKQKHNLKQESKQMKSHKFT